MNREIRLASVPKRIISLVPSQTELLLELGVEVIGITKFCIHPTEKCASIEKIGGTKSVNIAKIEALNPDLIIGNKEENTEADIHQLAEIAPVWMSDIATLKDAIEMIQLLGKMLEKEQLSKQMVEDISNDFLTLKTLKNSPKIAYLIWKNPFMLAGKQTFIDDMITRLGGINFTQENRYPIWEPQNTDELDYIFLSSEPYPFKQKDIDAFSKLFPTAKVQIVDGEMFSWYGSRLQRSTAYFKQLLTELTL